MFWVVFYILYVLVVGVPSWLVLGGAPLNYKNKIVQHPAPFQKWKSLTSQMSSPRTTFLSRRQRMSSCSISTTTLVDCKIQTERN
jgi:hypothetical protein